MSNKRTGGESGIRTHVTLSSKHAFQACAFSHSAISPEAGLPRENSCSLILWPMAAWPQPAACRKRGLCATFWEGPDLGRVAKVRKTYLVLVPEVGGSGSTGGLSQPASLGRFGRGFRGRRRKIRSAAVSGR